MRARFLIGLTLAMLAAPALAGEDSDIIRKFGLVGTWAMDCSRPPARDNIYEEYTAPGTGYPERSYYTDRDGRHYRFEMRKLRLVGSNRLAYLDVRKTDGDLTNVVIEMKDGRQRSVEATDPNDGKVYIKDGKLVATGKPTDSFEKCSNN